MCLVHNAEWPCHAYTCQSGLSPSRHAKEPCTFSVSWQPQASRLKDALPLLLLLQAPLDGVIVWGTSNCSMQHITGESAPVRLEPGKELPAGSLSTDGLLVVRVTAGTEDSTPARIARMAQEAQVSTDGWL